MMEPLDICFTFRSSPGRTMNVTTKNYVTDLGLTLASIDSAKIKLNALKTQHIFGSSNDIVSRISKHYSRQFMT
jgi:vacuolar protein sorting-associated protein 13A/C